MDNIYTLNTHEKIPKYFYVFSNRNPKPLINQSAQHNIKLRHGTLVSSGVNNIFASEEQREKFKNGELEYLPYVKGNQTTIGDISPFQARITERYTLEYNLEICRKYNYPTFPSRFSCLYAFGSYDDCKRIADGRNWKLNDVKKYELKDLGYPYLNQYIKIVKTNFKIIGFLENLRLPGLMFNVEDAFHGYWQGKGKCAFSGVKLEDDVMLPESRCGVLYEYLIEGILNEVAMG